MKLDPALSLARQGRLYPGVILHGGDAAERIGAAVALARTLLCEGGAAKRPCLQCRHCRRIVAPSEKGALFHPDFLLLERDLKTSTSAEATRAVLRSVQVTPFEARGQVFVVVSAETLSGGAADAFLKRLEEPPTSSPRHFLLLCPSASDLPATLRSRCLAIYLGAEGERARGGEDTGGGIREDTAELVAALAAQLGVARAGGGGVSLLGLARTLHTAGSFEDLRSAEPWTRAARAVVELIRQAEPPLQPGLRVALLGLAEELLVATEYRIRGIPAARILDGLVARHLAAVAAPDTPSSPNSPKQPGALRADA